jgi:hypothetical protein
MITPELAINIIERGLQLPIDKEYSNPRLAEIAKRRHEVIQELTALDLEIESLHTHQEKYESD